MKLSALRAALLGALFGMPIAAHCQTPPAYIGSAYGSSNSASGPVTIKVPAGTQNGDLMLAYIATQTSDGSWITAPAGWNEVIKTFNAIQGSQLFWHIANNEPASYTWSGTVYPEGVIRTYRGVNAAAPVGASAGCTSSAGTSCQIPAIYETAVPGERLVGFWDFDLGSESITGPSDLGNPSRDFTQRSMFSGDRVFTMSGGKVKIASETATVTGAGSYWDGIAVTVKPSGSATTLPPPPPANCVPTATYPSGYGPGDVDNPTVHSLLVTAMNNSIAANTANGCPAVPDIPHGMSNINDYSSTTVRILNKAHQWTFRGGPWFELNSNCSDFSINTGGSDVAFMDNIVSMANNAAFSGNAIADVLWSSNAGGNAVCGRSYAANPTAYWQMYGTFMANVVRRYPNQVYFELLNEVDNCQPHSCGAAGMLGDYNGLSFYQQGQQYAKMLATVVPMMRAVRSNIKIVLAGLGQIDTTSSSFIQGVFDAGGFKYLDVFNIHVYGGIQYRMLDESIYYKTWMAAHNIAIPFWVTEWGNQSGNLGNGQVDSIDQAAYNDLRKYRAGIADRDAIYSFYSADQYSLFPCGNSSCPTATEQWFENNP